MNTSNEYFVYTVSDPAPFCGDDESFHRRGPDADTIMKRVIAKYDHPAGLHYVAVYSNADAFHKRHKPLASYRHQCRFK